MRWGEHLIGALVVGILAVVIFEIVTGSNVSKLAIDTFSAFNIGSGITIAVLILLAVGIWAKSSRG